MWELSINKQHHAELELRHLQPVVQHLQHPNVEVSRLCAATLWGLAVNEQSRALMLQLHVVEALLAVARFSLTMQCMGDSDVLPGDYVAGGRCSQTQRNQLQVRAGGAKSTPAAFAQHSALGRVMPGWAEPRRSAACYNRPEQRCMRRCGLCCRSDGYCSTRCRRIGLMSMAAERGHRQHHSQVAACLVLCACRRACLVRCLC